MEGDIYDFKKKLGIYFLKKNGIVVSRAITDDLATSIYSHNAKTDFDTYSYMEIEIESLGEYKKPKRIPGVYFLYNKGEIVYIGLSIDCHQRVRQHRINKNFDSYSYIIEHDENLRIEKERKLIDYYLPVYNNDTKTNNLRLKKQNSNG